MPETAYWVQLGYRNRATKIHLLPVIEHSNRIFQHSYTTHDSVCHPLHRNVSRFILDADFASIRTTLGPSCPQVRWRSPHQVLGEHPKGCQEETLLHLLSGDDLSGMHDYLWMDYAIYTSILDGVNLVYTRNDSLNYLNSILSACCNLSNAIIEKGVSKQ